MPEAAVILFWPALVGYVQASVGYAVAALRPERAGASAIWGVRIGWLAQTALLVAQAADARGFPWGTWAGSLNLFVWMCVGAYLVWGCRPRFRLLGLAVMPVAAGLFVLAMAGGGGSPRADLGDLFLAVHVGLVLAAFAGFTLAAALAALYLWEERRLKRRPGGLLRLRAPSLASLDAFTAWTIGVALPALTVGVGVGFARLAAEGGGLDATMAATVAAWTVYATFLALRYGAGWRGRRSAYVALAGFALVVVIRLGLTPVTHF